MAQVRRSSAFREPCFDGVGLWWRHRCPGWFRVNVRSISLVLPFCRFAGAFTNSFWLLLRLLPVFCLSRSVLQKNIGLVGTFQEKCSIRIGQLGNTIYTTFQHQGMLLVHSAGLVHSTLDMTREATCCPSWSQCFVHRLCRVRDYDFRVQRESNVSVCLTRDITVSYKWSVAPPKYMQMTTSLAIYVDILGR